MSDERESRTVLGGRFKLKRLMGAGAFGQVWLATDSETGEECLVKLVSTKQASGEYVEHLTEIYQALQGKTLPGVLLPVASALEGDSYIQVFKFLPHSLSLQQMVQQNAPFDPVYALQILSNTAAALSALHDNNVVHADVKPSNILLPSPLASEIRLIDFGMARRVPQGTVQLVSTYAYLHPELRGQSVRGAGSLSFQLGSDLQSIGPFIDTFALGVVFLEMLTGKADRPSPLTERRLLERLASSNPLLRASNHGFVVRIANLLFQLLTVDPARGGIGMSTVSEIAKSLVAESGVRHAGPDGATTKRQGSPAPTPVIPTEISFVYDKLTQLRSGIVVETRRLIAEPGILRDVTPPKADIALFDEMTSAVQNALARTRTSWRIGVVMTVVSFALIAGMIVAALILSVTSGEGKWALIFGAASVPLIIGTLLWRPYDRVFRATILAQQIEMIHLRTVAGFRGTDRVERRLEIFQESIAALEQLFRGHAMPDGSPKNDEGGG